MLALALSLVGAVALELAAPPDLTPAETESLSSQLARALAAHAEAKKLDGEVLRYTVDVGATRLQVLAERLQADVVVARAAQVGPRDVERWWVPSVALIDALYGAPTDPDAMRERPTVVTEAGPPEPGVSLPSWVLLGTGAAALGVGVGFAASSADARTELSRGFVVEPELTALTSRADNHLVVAVSLSAAAVSCAIVGIVLWLTAHEPAP